MFVSFVLHAYSEGPEKEPHTSIVGSSYSKQDRGFIRTNYGM